MVGMLKAGWRARRNLKIYERWVKYFDDCPVPAEAACAECERWTREIGTVEHCREWVKYYKAVLS